MQLQAMCIQLKRMNQEIGTMIDENIKMKAEVASLKKAKNANSSDGGTKRKLNADQNGRVQPGTKKTKIDIVDAKVDKSNEKLRGFSTILDSLLRNFENDEVTEIYSPG